MVEVVIFIVVVTGIVYVLQKNKLANKSAQYALEYKSKNGATLELQGNGKFNYEIVGESHYQTNIKKALNLSGGRSSKSFQVRIVHDNYNKHDDKAIAVYIGKYLVGYFSRGKARTYRKMMKELGFKNKDALCYASVWGGGDKDYYGIWLDYSPRKTRNFYS